MSIESQKLEQLFEQAIGMPVEHRDQFVQDACAGDELMRDQFRNLLDAYWQNEESDFLEHPPASFAPTELHVAEIAEREGDFIGRYRLLEKIGEGGMGVVYMAEQTEGVRRRVALKIIKLGMDTKRVIARFEAERQAMAMFDHPNITRVFDAGATGTGRPYFVMELVKGTSITDYVRGHDLNLGEQLRLFVSVCHAVQHAHQKGIIHRDLKPSNILVTLYDGVPVPKVIDFGIAKAIGSQRLTDKTLFTRYSAMVGTPEYMSPEQAEMNGLDVDTRSDIYSLGVLLYELVTHTTPLSAEALSQVNPLALFETLRDVDIETPSARLARTQRETLSSNLSDTKNSKPSSDVSPRKSTSQEMVQDRIKGELDWVVMKALSRDRAMRYASANEMADDVTRFLNGSPVLAAPPSWSYQLKTLFRKHRTAAITTALVAGLVLCAAIACFSMAINLKKVNQELTQANSDLTSYVSQLEVAEQKVRESSESQKYSSAVKIALLKFAMDFEEFQFELAQKMFPDVWGSAEMNDHQTSFEVEADEIDMSEMEVLEDFVGMDLCFSYDETELLNLDDAKLLSTTLGRIRKTLEERENFFDRVYEKKLRAEEEAPEHEHSESCLKHQAASNAIISEHRSLFYRYLVREYRKSFGVNDARVAGALNALAAALIEKGEFDEAESRLHESYALADETDAQITKTLMNKLKSEKAHRATTFKKSIRKEPQSKPKTTSSNSSEN